MAVVAEPPRLQDRREGLHLLVEPHGRDAEPAEELLLGEPVLCHLERPRRRDRTRAPRRPDRHVLELVRDDLDALGESIEQRGIVIVADEELADVSDGRVRRRVEKPEREVEGDPREREHPPQLPAADDADDRQEPSAGSALASTDSVWAPR
jgi:hypothetical protein